MAGLVVNITGFYRWPVAAGRLGLGVSLRQGDSVKYAMQEAEPVREENSPFPPPSTNKTGTGRTVKYEWIESSFLERVESHFYTLYHLSEYLRAHPAYRNILEGFKCLLRRTNQCNQPERWKRSDDPGSCR